MGSTRVLAGRVRNEHGVFFAARQLLGHGVCRFSWFLLLVHWLSGAQVPQLVVRRSASRFATHAHPGELTPLSLSSKAILSRWLMRAAIASILVLGFTLASGVPDASAQNWNYRGFTTNEIAFTNGRTVLIGLSVGDGQSKSNIQKLIASSVAFSGWGVGHNPTNVTLNVGSNIVVKVELPAPKESPRQVIIGGHRVTLPPLDQFDPGCNAWMAGAEGTLQNIDFENRVIYIRARLRDVRVVWGR
jgi:hypothetical protein